MTALIATSLDGCEISFDVSEITHIAVADGVIYAGARPCDLDTVQSVEAMRLQHLADIQAAIISEKNDEIAALTANLSECLSRDYADDLANDSEGGLIEVTQ